MLISASVRDITPAELPEVARLAVIAREESSFGTQVCVGEEERIERHLAVFAQTPGGSVLVAHVDGAVAGFALVRLIEPGAFTDKAALYLEAIFVSDADRRRGIGHSLLEAVAHRGLETDAHDIYALPLPGSRGVQRFLARLGFAPAASHRVVSVHTLLRNIASESKHSTRRSSGRVLDDLIARRRRARTETNSGPLDLRAFQASYAAEQDENQASHRPAAVGD